ncbi:MAG: NIL domain-containing protein, partial [Dehalococcoidia bacterium]|nr:NIL domain-containing protein [Dehalococcoidia bacterium]
MAISKRVVLHFPSRSVDQPIIYRLVRDYNLVLNILKASVTPKEEGIMVLELSGARADYDKGIRYLQEAGVRIQSLGQDIMRNDARCT